MGPEGGLLGGRRLFGKLLVNSASSTVDATLLEVYSQEFEILKFFLDADLTGVYANSHSYIACFRLQALPKPPLSARCKTQGRGFNPAMNRLFAPRV